MRDHPHMTSTGNVGGETKRIHDGRLRDSVFDRRYGSENLRTFYVVGTWRWRHIGMRAGKKDLCVAGENNDNTGISNGVSHASLLSDTLASRSWSPFFWMYSSTGVKPPLRRGTRIISIRILLARIGFLPAVAGPVVLSSGFAFQGLDQAQPKQSQEGCLIVGLQSTSNEYRFH